LEKKDFAWHFNLGIAELAEVFLQEWGVSHVDYLVGGFNHLEKYESQWEGLSHILCKNNSLKPPASLTTAKFMQFSNH